LATLARHDASEIIQYIFLNLAARDAPSSLFRMRRRQIPGDTWR
jgi:hypothetical protein